MASAILQSCLAVLLLAASSALADVPESTRLYLSGQDSAASVNWEFMCTAGAKAGQWSTIPVPSNWEAQGFGTRSYGSLEPSESGHYRHRFHVPSDARAQRVFLVFDGVMTDTAVRLNGRLAGEKHQGGFYRFKYEVTSLLNYDAENLLEVDVDETSSDAGVNRAERRADYWNFGGIFRPVWLEIVPTEYIDRVAVDARANGKIAVHAIVNGQGRAVALQARILGPDGQVVGRPYSKAYDGEKAVLRWKVGKVAAWTAETPVLYTLQLDLVDEVGTVVHRTLTRLGFRTFEVRRGQGLFLNGQKIVLQGANRHSFNAETGRAMSEADHRTDISLAKEMNMNALRMSHYPPDERFLELCDELGIYVLDELGGWQKKYDTDVGRRLVEAMVVRDVNHPSILFWDNGNEGGWNTELDGEFARWDPQARPVLHPWGIAAGINTAHYKVYAHAAILAQGFTTKWDYDPAEIPTMGRYPLIYLPTEFLHGLYDGGAGAGLEDYWRMMRAVPTVGGGFLWVFRDEGLARTDGTVDVQGNAAPDGLIGPRGEKEASFYTIKELWSPLVLTGNLPAVGSTFRLEMENRYAFTDASVCRYTWKLQTLPVPQIGVASVEQTVARGTGTLPALAPARSGAMEISLPPNWREADVLSLRVENKEGAELWMQTWALPGIERLRALPSQSPSQVAAVVCTETPTTIEVTAGSVRARFDRTTGMLVDLHRDGRTLAFANGPRPAVGLATLLSMQTRIDGRDAVISATFSGALQTVEWRVRANGWIDCSYSYQPTAGSTFQGICFDLPEADVRAKTWIGKGPYRVWQNRTAGVTFGHWSNLYNDTITGWSGWTYPEFKGCFTDVRWLALDTTAGSLQVVLHSARQFVQILKPSFPPEKLQMKTRVELPDAGLAFLDVIPAVGSKFSLPDTTGPQGQLRPLAERYQHTISFSLAP